MKKSLAIVAAVLTFVTACKTTKEPVAKRVEEHTGVKNMDLACTNMNITFSGEIKSILVTHCSKCHNANNKAGYNFLTYASAKKAGEDDHLLGTIKHVEGYDKMPIGAPKLSQELIDKIECWINSGMKE